MRRSQELQGRRIRSLAVMVTKKRNLTQLFSFSICRLCNVVFIFFQITRVLSRTIAELCGKIGRFSPLKMSLICVIKLRHIPTSWQRSCGVVFFSLEDYSAKKNKKVNLLHVVMAALHRRCGHYIFALWFLLLSSFFFPRQI